MKKITLFIFLFANIIITQAQETPFLRILKSECSSMNCRDRSFEQIRILTQWHRDSGMDGFFKAADYVVDQAKKAGLVDVRFC